MTFSFSRASALVALLTVSVGLSACTVKKTEAPPLAGPSELGLAIRTSIFPDVLDWDGFSQSSVEIVARGPDGRPKGAVPVRAEIRVGGQVVDFGRLSTKTVVTGDDGVARLTYTSPPAPAEPVDTFTVVSLVLTPIGNDFNGSDSRFVEVRLVPRGVIFPPNDAPKPDFIVTPSTVTTFTPAIFNASTTTDEGAPCGASCSYSWDFGDGSSGSGMVTNHEYKTANTFSVKLTVVDSRRQSAFVTKTVTVTSADKPKADFVFSPTAPRFGQDIFFNAASSTASPGRKIVSYDWDFGSGRTGTGMTIAKRYDAPASPVPPVAVSYTVTLTVSDDTFSPGGIGVVSKTVPVIP